MRPHLRAARLVLLLLTSLGLVLTGLGPVQANPLPEPPPIGGALPEGLSSITGVVTDEAGDLLEGIEVILYSNQSPPGEEPPSWEEWGGTITASGEFTFEGLPADEWILQFIDTDPERGLPMVFSNGTDVMPESAAEGTPGVLATDGLTEQTFEITLYPAPEPPPVDATITGLVTDNEGNLLDGISVQAVRASDMQDGGPRPEPVASDLTYEGEAGEHGAFVLRVPAGEYVVRFLSLEEARDRYETVHVGTAQTPLKLVADQELDLGKVRLPRDTGIEVTGTVTDTAGEPLAGADVELYQVIRGEGSSYHRYVTWTTTDERGVYTIPGVNKFRSYTVYAQAHGYDWRYLGNTQNEDEADIFVAETEAKTLSPIELPTLATVSGTVTGNGEPLNSGYVSVTLYRWDRMEGFGYWEWWGHQSMGSESSYAFKGLRPGRYIVRAHYYNSWGHDGELGEPYLSTNLGGGHLRPRTYDMPGAFEIVDGELDFSGKDIDLERGVFLRGLATGVASQPVRHAGIQAAEWVEDPSGYKRLEWLNSWAYANQSGEFAAVVPKNSRVFIEGWAGRTYLPFQLGGTWPDEQREDNTLTIGETDYTDFEVAFTPLWDLVPSVAVQRDAHCLDHELSFGRNYRSQPLYVPWQTDPLHVNASGSITSQKTPHYRPHLLSSTGDRAILAPFMARVSRRYDYWPSAVSYGWSPDRESVCVTWTNRGHYGASSRKRNTFQAILAPAEADGLDVTFNYDQIRWTRRARVGYSEGTGEEGSFYTVPGFEGRGYRDDFEETGLVYNSLNSDQRGRYTFHFDGFEDDLGPAPVNETAPSIQGMPRVGEILTAEPGTWTVGGERRDDLEFGYFWYRLDGAATGGTTLVGEQQTYEVSEADSGAELVVVVAALLEGHRRGSAETASVTVAKLPTFESVNPPVIKGDARYGETLTVTPGTWDASDGTETQPTERSYQWLLDGKPVAGATGDSYIIKVGDVGRKVSVQETVSAEDMASGTATSAAVTVAKAAAPKNTAAPALSNTVRVGQVVTATQGAWDKAGTTRSYQWFVDGTQVLGATGSRYTPTAADAGKVLKVVETARLAGHEDGSATSEGVTVAKGAAPTASRLPSVTGNPLVGQTLTVESGSWSRNGLKFDYQWLRDGEPVEGATEQKYLVGEADKGRSLVARVTASTVGYEDGRASSQAVQVSDSEPAASNTAVPTISGTPKVGETLTASTGEWDRSEGLTFTYEWLYYWDGWTWPIWGADQAAFVPNEWQAGWPVQVRVTASRPGSTPVSVVSAATKPIAALPSLVATKAPSLTGEAMVGKTLTVAPATWNAEDPALEYTWYADWMQVHKGTGAEGASYTPDAGQRNRYLYVQVKATKPGYTDGYAGVGARVLREGTGTGSIGYTVTKKSGEPIVGASWTVCSVTGWDCLSGQTDDQGTLTARGLLASESGEKYKVSVWPNDELTFSGAEEVTLKTGETLARTMELDSKQPIPANAKLPTRNDWGGDREVPSVHFMEPQTIEVTGCATVEDPRYTVTFTDGTEPWEGVMTMKDEPVDGKVTFTATIAAFHPSHGDATISTTVPAECGGEPTEFSIYIDPSGIVTDQFGRPIEGANVTLYKADDKGTYTAVPHGSDIMSEDNRNNPSVTDDIGFFRWDVKKGWYKVGVTGAQSNGAACADAMTNGMEVPPIRVDLLIKVECADAAAPKPTEAPAITGTPQPGRTLTATRGAWAEPFVWQKTEWQRDGQTVGTGDTYTVAAPDQGKTLTALVTTGRPSYVQENGTGEVVTFTTFTTPVTVSVTAAPGGGGNPGGGNPPGGNPGGDNPGGETPGEEPAKAPVNTVKPAVTGTPRVGVELTATPGTWDTEGLTFGYQWLADGSPVTGATTAAYRPTAADAGKALTVTVTASKTGLPDGTASSEPVTVGRGAAAVPMTAPTVSGKALPGRTLTATPGTWSTEGLSFGYQWLRDGTPLAGATGSTYAVRVSDVGRTLSVEVTAARPGHEDGTATSPATQVGKLASTVRVKPVDRFLTGKARGLVKVVVAVPGPVQPTGTVVLRSAGQKLASTELRRKDGGSVLVALPRLSAGSHAVRAVYVGTDSISRSVSAPATLTVKPAKPRKAGTGRR